MRTKLCLAASAALLCLCGCDSWVSGAGVVYTMPDDEGSVSANVQFGHVTKVLTISAEALAEAPVATSQKPAPGSKAINTKELAEKAVAAAKTRRMKKMAAPAPATDPAK